MVKTLNNPLAGHGDDLRDMAYEYRRAAGIRLRAIREAAGLTQRELATAMDIVPTAVSAWETGRIALAPERYARFADVFDLEHIDFAKEMLRWTNPWLYVMIFPNDATAQDVREELASISERYINRLPPTKRTR